MKRLILCCDGTWNKPDQEDDKGVPCPSNVVKIAYRVAKRDGDTLQIIPVFACQCLGAMGWRSEIPSVVADELLQIGR